MRELKFDLNIDASALINPNPVEFFAKTYITEDVVNNFRALPGVKNRTKIATTSFDNVLKEATCNFSSDIQVLSAIEIDVESLSAMSQICRYDIEASFLSTQMAVGANASFEIPSFMTFYWDQLTKQIANEIAHIRWFGNKSLIANAGSYLGLVDGYEVKLKASVVNSTGVHSVTGATITATNVIDELTKVYNKFFEVVPSGLSRLNDIRIYVSPQVAAAYKLATASGNTLTFVTKSLDLTFLDVIISVQPGMSKDKIAMSFKDNFIYSFDGNGDQSEIKTVNMYESQAEPYLRSRVELKLGFHLVNLDEIVYYS